jgi:hypothetical protein
MHTLATHALSHMHSLATHALSHMHSLATHALSQIVDPARTLMLPSAAQRKLLMHSTRVVEHEVGSHTHAAHTLLGRTARDTKADRDANADHGAKKSSDFH